MQRPAQPKEDLTLAALTSALAREPGSDVFPAVEKFIQTQLESAATRRVEQPDREFVFGRVNAYQSLILAFRNARKAADSPKSLRAVHQKKSKDA